MYYICFDSYYNTSHYIDFIKNARNNGLKFKEYISSQVGYRWYIGLELKSDFPKFLKYDILQDRRYLLEVITPVSPSEQNYLLRKSNQASFERFVSPDAFKQLKTEKYACCFKYQSISKLREISLYDIKIYLLGTQKGNIKLALTFDKFINNYITRSDILIEKTKKDQYSKPGEFEYHLNNKYLVNVGLTNKMLEYPTIFRGDLEISKYPTGFFK